MRRIFSLWFMLSLSVWAKAELSITVLEPNLVDGEPLHVMLSVQNQHIDWTQVDLTPWLPNFDVIETKVINRWHEQTPAGSDYHIWLDPLADLSDADVLTLALPSLTWQGKASPQASVKVYNTQIRDYFMRPTRMSTRAYSNTKHRYSAELYVHGMPSLSFSDAMVNRRRFSVDYQRLDDVRFNDKPFVHFTFDFQLDVGSTGVLTVDWPSVSGRYESLSTRWLEPLNLELSPQQFKVVDIDVPDSALVADSAWLTLDFPKTNKLRVGDTLTFTLTTFALGTAQDFLTPLQLEDQYDGFTIYQGETERSETRYGNGWLARMDTEYTVAITKAGEWQLPEMSLGFYQPANQRFEAVKAPRGPLLSALPPLPTFNVQAEGPANDSLPGWLRWLLISTFLCITPIVAVMYWRHWCKPSSRLQRQIGHANAHRVWQAISLQAEQDGVSPSKLVATDEWPAAVQKVQQALVANKALTVEVRQQLRRAARAYKPQAAPRSPFI